MIVAVAITGLLLLAAPYLVHRVLGRRMAPRALAVAYLVASLAAAGAVLTLLVTLLVRLAPHEVARALGVGCLSGTSCSTILPAPLQTGLWLVSASLLLYLVVRLAVHVAGGFVASMRVQRWVRAQRTSPLSAPSGRLSSRCLIVIDRAEPLAFSVGLLRPRIVLSRGLVEQVSASELDAILAHEAAHCRARDNLGLLAARVLGRSWRFIPGVGSAAGRFGRAAELAADESARRLTGDALLVAESVHHVACLISRGAARAGRGGFAPSAVSAFASEGGVTERVRALTSEPRRVPRWRVVGAGLVLVVALSVFLLGSLAAADVNPAIGSPGPNCSSMVTSVH
jgi:Zn-dependent protease with chaperone function